MRYCWFLLSLTNSCKQSYPQVQAVILISEKLRTVNGNFSTS
ncbi:putative lipoprotein [Escherichia coli 1-176-05_S3_C2]|nr:putative lipoprotein [Escherichia coli 1-176-05_S3_C2]